MKTRRNGAVPAVSAKPAAVGPTEVVAVASRSARGRARTWIGGLLTDLLTAGIVIGVIELLALTGEQVRRPGLLAAATLLLWPSVSLASGAYFAWARRPRWSLWADLQTVVQMTLLGGWVLLLAGGGAGRWGSAAKLLAAWTLAAALGMLVRASLRRVLGPRLWSVERVLIIGNGKVATAVEQKLRRHPEYGVEVVGFLDDDLDDGRPAPADGSAVAGAIRAVDHVIVAFSRASHQRTQKILREARRAGVAVHVVPRFFESVGPSASFHAIEGLPVISLARPSGRAAQARAKRAFDIVLSGLGLVVLAPFFAYVAVRIKLDSPGPVFYRHERLTAGGRSFNVIKFRTMRQQYSAGDEYGGADADAELAEMMSDPDMLREFSEKQKVEHDPRVTRYGQVLRTRSLDELPQLINVLRGDMSLVGPRPITAEELERYGPEAVSLLSVRPGLTGYWQINGRSHVPFEERVWLDMAYIDARSMGLDVRILLRTIPLMRGDDGAY